jgi:hypothetical protein
MEGHIHFRFKSAKDFLDMPLAGPAITLDALKRAIFAKAGLRSRDVDLAVSNAHTGTPYTSPSELIPRDSSVVIARVLLAPHEPCNNFVAETNHTSSTPTDRSTASMLEASKAVFTFSPDDGSSEEAERLNWIVAQSRQFSHTVVPHTHTPRPRGHERMCFFCRERGHLIDSCPKRRERERIASERAHQRWLRLNKHQALRLGLNRASTTRPPHSPTSDSGSGSSSQTPLPDHLMCPICRGPQQEAVSLPCCAQTFCDTCIRSHLLTALSLGDTPACFSCQHAEIIPDSLAPNTINRAAVAAWAATDA